MRADGLPIRPLKLRVLEMRDLGGEHPVTAVTGAAGEWSLPRLR